jgi:Putative phage serine protease XkdF
MKLFDDIEKAARNRLTIKKLIAVAAVDEPAQPFALNLIRKDSGSGVTPILVVKRAYQAMPEGLVTGICAVSTIHGTPHFDSQGDYLDNDQLHEMAKALTSGSVVFNPMHLHNADGSPINAGHCVEAAVIDAPLAKALKIPLPGGMECLIATFKVTDPKTLRMIEQGHLTGFSIEGQGVRTPVEKRQPLPANLGVVLGWSPR